jgi:hypothetical protein
MTIFAERMLGAARPGLLRILGFLPIVGVVFFVLGSVWMLAAMFVAIRQALDYRHVTPALAVCVVGWLLSLLFVAIIGFVFAVPVWKPVIRLRHFAIGPAAASREEPIVAASLQL